MDHSLNHSPHLQINDKSKISCPTSQIIRLEAKSNYCEIITQNQNYFIPKTLKRFDLVLPANFIRLHSKHLVNTEFISVVHKNYVIMTNNDVVGMSRRKKNNAMKVINHSVYI